MSYTTITLVKHVIVEMVIEVGVIDVGVIDERGIYLDVYRLLPTQQLSPFVGRDDR